MATRLKAALPLTLSIGLLAFLASEVALNFTFHWVTVENGVFGAYGVPQNVHLILPALFVAWGLYFLLGADNAALGKTVIAAATGSVGAGIAMWIGPMLAESPDFWGLALMIGITGAGLIVLSTAVEDDRFAPAPAFCCYAAVFFWWIATGLDNFVPGGKGPHTRGGGHRGDHGHAAGGRHRRVRRPALDVLDRGDRERVLLARRAAPCSARCRSSSPGCSGCSARAETAEEPSRRSPSTHRRARGLVAQAERPVGAVMEDQGEADGGERDDRPRRGGCGRRRRTVA